LKITEDSFALAAILVTLLLAITAVQFVLNQDRPESSYVLPTQQLVKFLFAAS
jgi:hypothetical protein